MYYTPNGFACLEEGDPIEWAAWAVNYNSQNMTARILDWKTTLPA